MDKNTIRTEIKVLRKLMFEPNIIASIKAIKAIIKFKQIKPETTLLSPFNLKYFFEKDDPKYNVKKRYIIPRIILIIILAEHSNLQ
ncbi:hypothetical protein HN789_03285 [archaeon]|nr:hypothetical protein [archaeon]MBT4022624.1 hypothetical protein [archaeon]MBT4272064.1 hypothetical protein [archaeon]MBT4461161.1 hypothetical protein [archaeon]MBT4858846.1 hypothetical protein [archaeon]